MLVCAPSQDGVYPIGNFRSNAELCFPECEADFTFSTIAVEIGVEIDRARRPDPRGKFKMVTLRKFLNKEEDLNKNNGNHTRADQPGQLLRPLLTGIAHTALNLSSEEHAAFQRAVDEIGESLPDLSSSESTLALISEVIQLLGAYNQGVRGCFQATQDELHRILSMTMETVAFLGASSSTSVQQLSVIERSLQSASNAGDLKLIQNKLFACLSLVRTESVRLQVESEKMIKDLKAAVLRASTHILPYVAATPADPVTGLAGPNAVREVISRSLSDGKSVFVAVFVFEQIPGMNQHLGRKIADRVLSASARRLSAELAEFGPVLRWNGPAVAFIIDQNADIANAVQGRVKQVADKRIEDSVEVDGKVARFRLNFSWTVWDAVPGNIPEELFRKMDDFVAARTNVKTLTPDS